MTKVILGYTVEDVRYNRVFLGLVKSYVKINPDITGIDLLTIFKGTNENKAWENSLVVRLKTIEERNDEKRYFLAKEELITLIDGEQYAVSNQWTKVALEKFIEDFNKRNGLKITLFN